MGRETGIRMRIVCPIMNPSKLSTSVDSSGEEPGDPHSQILRNLTKIM